MTALWRYSVGGLVRSPGRTCVRVLTLAASCALLAAMLLFIGHSLRTMTGGAVRAVALVPRAGGKPIPYRVGGVVLVTAGDTLFQPLNPLVGPAPAQPPANVAILPLETFTRTLAPRLGTNSTATPAAASAPGTVSG